MAKFTLQEFVALIYLFANLYWSLGGIHLSIYLSAQKELQLVLNTYPYCSGEYLNLP